MPSLKRDESSRWRRVRKAVLIRDSYRCQIQTEGICTHTATCVHHTLGQALTGNNPAFLLASCFECNNRIGEPDGGDAQPRRTTQW